MGQIKPRYFSDRSHHMQKSEHACTRTLLVVNRLQMAGGKMALSTRRQSMTVVLRQIVSGNKQLLLSQTLGGYGSYLDPPRRPSMRARTREVVTDSNDFF